MGGELQEVENLLRKGVDSSDDNNIGILNEISIILSLLDTAIRNAAENGHLEIVKLLIQDNRVDPSVNNCSIKLFCFYFFNFYLKSVKKIWVNFSRNFVTSNFFHFCQMRNSQTQASHLKSNFLSVFQFFYQFSSQKEVSNSTSNFFQVKVNKGQMFIRSG